MLLKPFETREILLQPQASLRLAKELPLGHGSRLLHPFQLLGELLHLERDSRGGDGGLGEAGAKLCILVPSRVELRLQARNEVVLLTDFLGFSTTLFERLGGLQ